MGRLCLLWNVIALTGFIGVAGCGRLGFDEHTPNMQLTTGASTADLELCMGGASYWITTVPLAAGERADALEAQIAQLQGDQVLHAGQTTATPWCTTVTGIPIGPEQIPIYAYATSSPGRVGEVLEATATMKPTWTREATPNGVTVWVHRPEAMYRDPSAEVPTLMFFHGRGHTTGTGFDPTGVDRMPRDSGFLELFGEDIPGANPPRLGNLIEQPFLVLAPNCVEGGTLAGITLECEGWASSDVVYDETIAYAGARFPIDAHRSYVTGLSTGGEGTFRIAVTRSDKVAAVVPIASTNTSTQWFVDYCCAAVDVPVWAFHSMNDQDGQTSFMSIQFWVDNLNGCARKPTELAQFDLGDWKGPNQEGHAGWLQVYSDTHGKQDGRFTSIYAWLLAHTR